MAQSAEQKIAAVKRLLGLVNAHYCWSDGVRTSLRIPRAARRQASLFDPAKDEGWVEMKRNLHRRLRLADVEAALKQLAAGRLTAKKGRLMATCIQYEYVEPFPHFQPRDRAYWADQGVRAIASSLAGDVPNPALDCDSPERVLREARDEEIVRLSDAGQKVDFLVRHFHLSPLQVERIIISGRIGQNLGRARAFTKTLRRPSLRRRRNERREGQLSLW